MLLHGERGQLTRPVTIPEYKNPPLDEVVLGLQFTPAPTFSSVANHDVFRLFREDFPRVEEHPLLEPYYETFGGSNPQHSIQVNIGAPPTGSRLWFVSRNEDHLLQFQPDRLLTNWRRRPEGTEYPQFDGIAEAFSANAKKLDNYLTMQFDHPLIIDQTEVCYINIIPLNAPAEVGKWLRVFNLDTLDIEGFQAGFAEMIRDPDGRAMGRLTYDFQHIISRDGQSHALRLILRARGQPTGQSVDAAFNFMARCHDEIVARFDKITTTNAHSKWKKVD